MAGVKGRSGPAVGNQNALRHPVNAWLKRRALPKDKAHIARMIRHYRRRLLVAKGGATASEVKQALIDNAAIAHGAILLVLEEAKDRGLVAETDQGWDLVPALGRLVGFLNAERASLVAIGVDREELDVTPRPIQIVRYDAPGNGADHGS